jgi:hypothetical protein
MMALRVGSAMVLSLALAASLYGDGKNPTIQALKARIKQLRAEEKAEVKAIQERYKLLIAKLEDPVVKDEELRAELRKEEQAVLKGIKDAKEKKLVRERFAALIKGLTADIKSRKAVIKGVKAEEKLLVNRIKSVFAEQISQLEAEILMLEQGGKTKPPKKK